MDVKELKKLLLDRLYLELQLFKDATLQQEKEEIYKSSYKIETFTNIYEILLEGAGQLKEGTVRRLIFQRSGILDALYQEWLTRDDCIFDELKAYVVGELEAIAQEGSQKDGKEAADGTGTDQAA